jgi:N-acylneuraminate cytidylyltransferase
LEKGVGVQVISKEQNPVVAVRCQKLKIPCLQGVDDKLPALRDLATSLEVSQASVAYIGNDVNDVDCVRWAGVGAAPSDANQEALDAADLVLTKPGGLGAVREFADRLLRALPPAGGPIEGSHES